MDRSWKSVVGRSCVVLTVLHLSQIWFPALPALAAPDEPTATAPGMPDPPADDASAARGKAVLAQVDAQLATTQSVTLTISSVTLDPKTGAPSPPALVALTLDRPGYVSADVSFDGKPIGKFVVGPDGGVVYDSAGNRYTLIKKGDTPAATFQQTIFAADHLLPFASVEGIGSSRAFIEANQPFVVHPFSDGKGNIAIRSTDDVLNGEPVDRVTQTLGMGQSEVSYTVDVVKSTHLPARVTSNTTFNGHSVSGYEVTFSKIRLSTTVSPTSTFEFTPPATATEVAAHR